VVPLSGDVGMNVGSVVELSTTDAYAKIGLSDVKLTHESLRSALPALKKTPAAMFVGLMTASGGIAMGVPVATSALFLSYSRHVTFAVVVFGFTAPMLVRKALLDLS